VETSQVVHFRTEGTGDAVEGGLAGGDATTFEAGSSGEIISITLDPSGKF
jgi:hypothetical protein